MEVSQEVAGYRVGGGVDTHKDLHVAAVVDDQDRVLGSQCFATTRQGYRQMLAWMRSFGTLQRIGVEATGTYGAGLALHAAGRFSRSRHRTSTTVANAAKTTISMPRTLHTQPSLAGALSRQKVETA
jgi:transposase